MPPDPQNKFNKFITKVNFISVCILDIAIKIGLSFGSLVVLLSQIKPKEVTNGFLQNIPNRNISI